MATVDFSTLATADLESIVIYVSDYNLTSAQKMVKELMKKFQLLAENPKLGISRDNYILGMRSFPYKDYVIYYFPTENGVEIYRVIHGARNIDDLFDELIEGLKP
jgi:toxin ParE1/3/4